MLHGIIAAIANIGYKYICSIITSFGVKKSLKSTGFADFSGSPSNVNILCFVLCVCIGERGRKKGFWKQEKSCGKKEKIRETQFFFSREEGGVREQGAEMYTSIVKVCFISSGILKETGFPAGIIWHCDVCTASEIPGRRWKNNIARSPGLCCLFHGGLFTQA